MIPLKMGQGHVYHSRKTDAENSFRYGTYFLFFNISAEKELYQVLKEKFFGVLSFKSKDYLQGEAESLQVSLNNFLKKHVEYEPEEVWLQTMPRIFGYAFNPVSFWIFKRGGIHDAVLCEVNNTFGERHFYWLHSPGESIQGAWHSTKKMFHVSPFQPIRGYYDFRFQIDDKKSSIDIFLKEDDGSLRLSTNITGVLYDIQSRSLMKLLWEYGWMTPLVVFRIHYQAVKLFFKKVRFYKKPALPDQELSQ